MVSAGEVPEWVADQMGHLDTRMVAEVYAKWVRRPDMTPGASAARAYAEEWAKAAQWADRVDTLPAEVEESTTNAVDDEDDDEEL